RDLPVTPGVQPGFDRALGGGATRRRNQPRFPRQRHGAADAPGTIDGRHLRVRRALERAPLAAADHPVGIVASGPGGDDLLPDGVHGRSGAGDGRLDDRHVADHRALRPGPTAVHRGRRRYGDEGMTRSHRPDAVPPKEVTIGHRQPQPEIPDARLARGLNKEEMTMSFQLSRRRLVGGTAATAAGIGLGNLTTSHALARLAALQNSPVKIDFWHRHSGDTAKEWDKLAAQFNTEMAGKVEVTTVPQGNIQELNQKI